MAFTFLNPTGLRDNEIYLALESTGEANRARGWVPSYYFRICRVADDAELGHISLRVGRNENTWYGGNIGYDVHPAHRGHRYAGKACRLLFPFAARHGMAHVIITCNPDNLPSRRTCERLGGTLLEITDLPPHNELYAQGDRQKCIFRFEVG